MKLLQFWFFFPMFALAMLFTSRIKGTEFLELVGIGKHTFSFPFGHDLIFFPSLIESIPPIVARMTPPGEDLCIGKFKHHRDPRDRSRFHKFWDFFMECVLYGNSGRDKGSLFGIDARQESSKRSDGLLGQSGLFKEVGLEKKSILRLAIFGDYYNRSEWDPKEKYEVHLEIQK